MASREDIVGLTDRMRRHDVSRPPRARRVPQFCDSPRDDRNARAGNGRRPGKDTARSSLSRHLATDFARLREKRDPLCDVKYDVSIRVPDCMPPPPPSPPVLRRATLEMLATPKRVPEKEQRRAASAAASAARVSCSARSASLRSAEATCPATTVCALGSIGPPATRTPSSASDVTGKRRDRFVGFLPSVSRKRRRRFGAFSRRYAANASPVRRRFSTPFSRNDAKSAAQVAPSMNVRSRSRSHVPAVCSFVTVPVSAK